MVVDRRAEKQELSMDILKTIISPIVQCAVGPIWSEISYIIFYKGNIDNFTIQLQHLEAARQTLQQRVDAAHHNGEEIFIIVNLYMAKADVTIAEANKVEDNNEEHERVGCLNGPFQNLWAMHQKSRKANDNANKISGVLPLVIAAINMPKISQIPSQVNEATKMPTISSQPCLQLAFPPSDRGYEALHSRTSILVDIMQELKDDNIYMIGVYGMGGVGKTALIQELAWQAEQSHDYGYCNKLSRC